MLESTGNETTDISDDADDLSSAGKQFFGDSGAGNGVLNPEKSFLGLKNPSTPLPIDTHKRESVQYMAINKRRVAIARKTILKKALAHSVKRFSTAMTAPSKVSTVILSMRDLSQDLIDDFTKKCLFTKFNKGEQFTAAEMY